MSIFKASAPGSLMIMGEHAVLHNHHALVCAIDQRMSVQLVPRDDTHIEIHSALGHYQTHINNIEVVAPFQFVLATLKKFQNELKTGCTISIESEFSDQLGLASSAAVTVATVSVLSTWLKKTMTNEDHILIAREVVRSVQGMGSGADVAACVLGGVVAYRAEPLMAKKIENALPLTVLYSGSKMKTTEVLSRVKKTFSSYPELLNNIMQAIGECAEKGMDAIIQKDLSALGRIMNIQQGLMDALLVNTPVLNHLIEELRTFPGIDGAKISGSGLGDCVIGLGKADVISKNSAARQLAVNITPKGVYSEKI